MTEPYLTRTGHSPLMPFAVLLLTATISPTAASAAKPSGEQGGWRPKRAAVVQTSATTEPSSAAPFTGQGDRVAEAPEPTVGGEAVPVTNVVPVPAEELLAEPVLTIPADPESATKPSATKRPLQAQPGTAPAGATVPACIQCGATCNLLPFCRCEPATRKKPKTIYESKCELVCEPAVGLLGHHQPKTDGCTDCRAACGPSRICKKKTLIKTVKDAEVCQIERKVGYLCRCCAGECGGCDDDACGASSTGRRPTLFGWNPFAWLEQLCR